jgi:hypothetical protein
LKEVSIVAGLAEDAAAIRKLEGDNPKAVHLPIRMKPDMAGLFKEYREMRRKEDEKNAVQHEP